MGKNCHELVFNPQKYGQVFSKGRLSSFGILLFYLNPIDMYVLRNALS